jgi:hypothetical protein
MGNDINDHFEIEARASALNASKEKESSACFAFFVAAESLCDCGCSERVSQVCLYFWIYLFGLIIVALFAYGCTATAYTYSYNNTLGIWLGIFLPCAFICTFFGGPLYVQRGVILPSFFAGTCFVGLLVGLIGGIYFLAPWWMLKHLDTAYNVDAAALDLIGNGTQPTAGIFYFQPSAFVNQERYGHFVVTSKKLASRHYCTAPIVASSTQARVVYWVTDDGDCCASSSTSCWNSFASPGSISGAYLQVRRPEFIGSNFEDARTAACARLAALSANYSAASICALPAAYLKLDPTPEATRDSLFSRGIVYVGVLTGLWPFTLCVMSLGMVMLPRGWRRKY